MGSRCHFPKEYRVSARVTGKTYRLLKEIPYSYGEILAFGADYMASEIQRLKWEKGELEVDIEDLKKQLHEKKGHLKAVNNRLRFKSPQSLNPDELQELIQDAAKEYADEVYDTHKENSLERIKNEKIQMSVHRTARWWGYDPNEFLKWVIFYLNEKCHTSVSYISAENLENNV